MPWTETTRRHYVRSPTGYASDTSDAEWLLIAPFMPKLKRVNPGDLVGLSPEEVCHCHFHPQTRLCFSGPVEWMRGNSKS